MQIKRDEIIDVFEETNHSKRWNNTFSLKSSKHGFGKRPNFETDVMYLVWSKFICVYFKKAVSRSLVEICDNQICLYMVALRYDFNFRWKRSLELFSLFVLLNKVR